MKFARARPCASPMRPTRRSRGRARATSRAPPACRPRPSTACCNRRARRARRDRAARGRGRGRARLPAATPTLLRGAAPASRCGSRSCCRPAPTAICACWASTSRRRDDALGAVQRALPLPLRRRLQPGSARRSLLRHAAARRRHRVHGARPSAGARGGRRARGARRSGADDDLRHLAHTPRTAYVGLDNRAAGRTAGAADRPLRRRAHAARSR